MERLHKSKEVTFVYNWKRIGLMEKASGATPLLQIIDHIHMSKDQYISVSSFLLLLNKICTTHRCGYIVFCES